MFVNVDHFVLKRYRYFTELCPEAQLRHFCGIYINKLTGTLVIYLIIRSIGSSSVGSCASSQHRNRLMTDGDNIVNFFFMLNYNILKLQRYFTGLCPEVQLRHFCGIYINKLTVALASCLTIRRIKSSNVRKCGSFRIETLAKNGSRLGPEVRPGNFLLNPQKRS
ncbi:uncharacterized protein LOC143210554 [Lasioglossum baleicum]|uniref:uncharacterized protein LOC143210554 n=1 Tax=Lasioglossum baleicum TaxID=434251 RepID=UPI003FCC40DF